MSGMGSRRHGAAAPEPRPADTWSRRLMIGVAVVVPLATTLALVAALGGTAALLGPAHANDAGAGAEPGGASVPKSGLSGADHGAPLRALTLSQVSASGDTVVAVGAQGSATPSFRVSEDGGRTWTAAAISSQAGPVTGHPATILAGGPGGWVGLGPHAIWVSATGLTWTLVSARGLAAPGETITGVTKDSWGYLATGTSARPGTGLVWTSPNGVTWRERTAAQFGLVNAPDEQVFAMTEAGTDWNVTLIAGSAHKDGKTCSYVWRSLDNGASWRTVVVPQAHGGDWSFAGLAGDAGHFIAVRPGTAPGGRADAVVYASADGINWDFTATIPGSAGFTPEQVTAGSGGTGRFVVTGRDAGGQSVAYTSTDNGATWTQSGGFGLIPTA
ncbi:MAG: sialidase family protein [Trebonia sp.]